MMNDTANSVNTVNLILTGATGMVGEGVLHECLNSTKVRKVLVVTRKPTGIVHPKMEELLLADFFDVSAIKSQLSGYDGCLFCLGVSSVGMNEQQYTHVTYDLTLNFAKTLVELNPSMTFCYISGSGTDSSERGRLMWARVKGKTENDLVKLPFKAVYNFRPGMLEPTKGLKNTLSYYRYLSWTIPVIRKIAPKFVCTLKQLGLAMINAVSLGYEKPILEVPDIVMLSKRYTTTVK